MKKEVKINKINFQFICFSSSKSLLNTKELFTIIYAEDPENIKYIYKKQNPSEKDESHFPIWIIILIVIGVLILIVLIMLLIKRHKLNDNENTNKKIEELNYI